MKFGIWTPLPHTIPEEPAMTGATSVIELMTKSNELKQPHKVDDYLAEQIKPHIAEPN